jgi:hypothetical protein
MYVTVQSEILKDDNEAFVLSNSFEDFGSENVLRIEEVKQEKQTLVKEACPSVLVHKKEMFSHVFHDPVACYMESFNNQNLQLMMGCNIRDEDDVQSMSALNMDFFLSKDLFQSVLCCS